ncbi:class A beta-lactamase-related serine hydrolase [Cellulomonas sp. P24]|uniref:class A beta-lactamase-related serine hydrolase n=1 Tax=Cellulomonas sp. P24 TaxID=2885206 RepID=UPI00216B2004|nr:class A beta-lactamase-related serine hydrolase [Cellulomonas sp. P24]MCR6493204.1 class A beta-lactamase-related serine hydrolase [Cellulomonas sp. P24]
MYALNLDTGLAASYNPATAFVTASIVKVDLVAALLLRAQDAARELTATERSLATAAITASSNDAATSIFQAIGGAGGLASANARLGLVETTPRSSWGLTTTSAADQVRLLTALTSDNSPLTASSRAYLLGLMSEVCDDQDWGVTAAGDDDAPVKNGWLPYSGDGYAWEVNSIGIVTVGSQRVLIAVLTRHGATEESGIALVEQLSRLAAAAVT